MVLPPLKVDARVSGEDSGVCRITITFSHKSSAEQYNEYLTTSNFSHDRHHCYIDKSVSMNLPPETTSRSINGGKGVVLVFKDEEEAMAWETQMILWGKGKDQDKRERSIVQNWKVGDFNEKLGLPSPGLRDTVYAVHRGRSSAFL
jgi:hypothetical protein